MSDTLQNLFNSNSHTERKTFDTISVEIIKLYKIVFLYKRYELVLPKYDYRR